MDKSFFPKFICTLIISPFATFCLIAQDGDIFKQLIKESMKMDFLTNPLEMEIANDSIPGYIELNVNKNPLPVFGFNYLQNSLYLQYKDSLPMDDEAKMIISEGLMKPYTNLNPKLDTAPIYNYEHLLPALTYSHLSGNGFLNVTGMLGLVISLFSEKEGISRVSEMKLTEQEKTVIVEKTNELIREHRGE